MFEPLKKRNRKMLKKSGKVLRIRISLGPCNMEIATFRLKRAEKVVLCIFQEHLIVKSKDCEVLTVSFYSAPIMRRADQT